MRRALIPAIAVKKRNVMAVGQSVPFVHGWAKLASTEQMKSYTTAALVQHAFVHQYQFRLLETLSVWSVFRGYSCTECSHVFQEDRVQKLEAKLTEVLGVVKYFILREALALYGMVVLSEKVSSSHETIMPVARRSLHQQTFPQFQYLADTVHSFRPGNSSTYSHH